MYTKMPINFLETCFILNILLFSVFTWYSLSNANINQKTAAYTSVLTTFILLLLIILYHVYMYITVFLTVKETKLNRMINSFFSKANPAVRAGHHWWPLHNVAAGPVKATDYDVPLLDQQPTYSVVDGPKFHLDQLDPENAIMLNNTKSC